MTFVPTCFRCEPAKTEKAGISRGTIPIFSRLALEAVVEPAPGSSNYGNKELHQIPKGLPIPPTADCRAGWCRSPMNEPRPLQYPFSPPNGRV